MASEAWKHSRDRYGRNRGDPLSAREEHVLFLLADGLENTEIAKEIEVSVETVKTHVRALLAKLGARNRTHAVALAYHRGVLVPRHAANQQQDATADSGDFGDLDEPIRRRLEARGIDIDRSFEAFVDEVRVSPPPALLAALAAAP